MAMVNFKTKKIGLVCRSKREFDLMTLLVTYSQNISRELLGKKKTVAMAEILQKLKAEISGNQF